MAAIFALSWCLSASGCLWLSGPRELEKLIQNRRETPFAIVTFKPGAEGNNNTGNESVRPLEELRATLTHWSSPGTGDRPRWHGVLSPHPENLYSKLIETIDAGAPEIKLVSYAYDSMGLDVLTLVDYYDENGTRIGWDFMSYEATEAEPPAQHAATIGYGNMAAWEYGQLVLDLPIYLAIGTKELAGEIAKSPLSAIDVGWFDPMIEGRSPLSLVCFERAGHAFVEDWRDGATAFLWRFRTRTRHTPLDLLRNLGGAVPLVGPVFDHKSPPESNTTPTPKNAIILGQGIHAGGRDRQFLRAWENEIRQRNPERRTLTLPFRHGGAFDIVWSLLNLSQGTAHDAATQLVFDRGFGPGDSLQLVGFSGSAQRFVAATRLLRQAGVSVESTIGIAAPVGGYSCARRNFLLLGADPLGDPIALSVHATRFLLPFPNNLDIIWVDEAGGHHTPGLPHAETRQPHLGYVAAVQVLLEGP